MERPAGEPKPARWPARVMASLALAGAALAVLAIVNSSLGGDEDQPQRAERARTATIPGCEPEAKEAVENGYYVIEPGEPGLSSVASRTCIPIERLERLNENLDPQAIPPAACIDLRRNGCKALAAGDE